MQRPDENRHVRLEGDRSDRDSLERITAQLSLFFSQNRNKQACPRTLLSFKITEVLGWKPVLIDLKELDQNPIRGRNHNIFPESQVRNTFLDDNASGSELINHLFDIVGLDSKMVDAPSPGGLGRLIIEVDPAAADSHEYVSRTRKLLIENHPAPEEFFVECDGLLNIRGKNMNMMNMTNQPRPPPFSRTSFYTLKRR